MQLKDLVFLSNKTYKILKKLNLDDKLPIDTIIDAHYPALLSYLQNFSDIAKVAICMTNGKASATNIFNQILNSNNNTYITNVNHNKETKQILSSVLNHLPDVKEINIEENKQDYYSMAIDEKDLFGYFNSMKFDYLLLGNIFTDQKDGLTLEEKRKKIQDALILNSKISLIINADEPCFHNIDEFETGKKREKFYFGFDSIEFLGSNADIVQKNDFFICPKCSCKLDYKKRFYSHIGQYDCECGFKRPKPDVRANAKIYDEHIFLNVFYKEDKYVFKLPFSGIAQAYNALGVIALAIKLKIPRSKISFAFENFNPNKYENIFLNKSEKKIVIKTIKNPTSLSCELEGLYGKKNAKIVFCLNDTEQDGLTTNWIWDANFNAILQNENKIYVTSKRLDDMALRLKYAKINPCLIVMDSKIKNAIECCFWELEENEKMYVITTPSLSSKIYQMMKKEFAIMPKKL